MTSPRRSARIRTAAIQRLDKQEIEYNDDSANDDDDDEEEAGSEDDMDLFTLRKYRSSYQDTREKEMELDDDLVNREEEDKHDDDDDDDAVVEEDERQQQQQQPHEESAQENRPPPGKNDYPPESIKQARQTLLQAIARAQQDQDLDPLMVWLLPSNRTRNLPTSSSAAQKMSLSQQRQLFLYVIEHSFSKTQGRDYFDALHQLLVSSLSGIMSSSSALSSSHTMSSPQPHASDENGNLPRWNQEMLAFVHWTALSVQAHVQSRVGKITLSRSHPNKPRRGPPVSGKPISWNEDTHQLALLLHNLLYPLHQQHLQQHQLQSSGSRQPQSPSWGTLRDAILKLCEACWHQNLAHREQLVPQTVGCLIHQILDPTSPDGSRDGPHDAKALHKKKPKNKTDSRPTAQIQRLYQMREALTWIDWTDSAELRRDVARLVLSPACLHAATGQQLLAFLLTLDPVLAQDVHQAMRVQIPGLYHKKTLLRIYGRIYWQAWKDGPSNMDRDGTRALQGAPEDAEDDPSSDHGPSNMREFLETNILSDLVYAVLHVQQPSTHQSLMTVLEPLHQAKPTAAGQDLLYRLYGPLLWRSLAASHAQVRLQAAQVLAQVFPLNPSSSSLSSSLSHKKKKDTMAVDYLTKAGQALGELLQDDSSRVRVAGSQATATILVTYWTVLPTDQIRSLLNQLVMQHASDASSSAVRTAAVQAVTALLEAPCTRAVLRPLLPLVGNLIHDRVERVRLAVVRLLLRVKSIDGIKYYHVVPVDHLTARLVADGQKALQSTSSSVGTRSAVASALTGLMLNSYFPQGPQVTGVVQMQRTLTFLQNDPDAAAVFYAHAYPHLPIHQVAKLIAMLLRCLHTAVVDDQLAREKAKSHKADLGRKRRRQLGVRPESAALQDDLAEADGHDSGQKEAPERADPILSVSNSSLMASLAETICTLWESIEKDLDRAQESCKFLLEEFSGPTLTVILQHFELRAREFNASEHRSSSPAFAHPDDWHRACAAILRTAGRLPSEAVEGLVSYISDTLQSIPDTGDKNDSLSSALGSQNYSSHVALLCLWGMTEDVSSSLASSIEAAFESDQALLFSSPAADSRKRKSGRTKKNARELVVPHLASSVAMNILSEILSGANPSSVAARQAILRSPSSCETLQLALGRGLKHADLLLTGDLNYCQSVRDDDVEYILHTCEAFGRFALHRAAAAGDDIPLTDEAMQLLKWTTLRVVPALTSSTKISSGAPFDPDISRIAVEKSFEALSMSPIPTGPPKRRTNRNTTPIRTSEILEEDGSAAIEVAAKFTGQVVAISLLRASCLIFSEWLNVGTSGASEVADASIQWSRVLGEADDDADRRPLLLPAFARLAVVLGKTWQEYGLLKEMIMKCEDEASIETSTLRTALKNLFNSRGAQGLVTVRNTASCIRYAAHELLKKSGTLQKRERPVSIESLWPNEGGSVSSALFEVFSSKAASTALAKQMIASLPDTANQASKGAVLFDVHCLWLLCDGKMSKVGPEATRLLHQAKSTITSDDDDIRAALQDLYSLAGDA